MSPNLVDDTLGFFCGIHNVIVYYQPIGQVVMSSLYGWCFVKAYFHV